MDLLLFAEDPSAASYLAMLLPEFGRRGWRVTFLAANVACGVLRSSGVDFVETDASANADEILARLRPRCVLTGTAENPDTLGLALIWGARRMGIVSIAFSDARMHSEHRFRGSTRDPLAHAPDWLLVPDEWTLESFERLGLPRHRIAVCGHPKYDKVRELAREWSQIGVPAFRRRLFPEVSPNRPIAVFVSEGSVRYELLKETPIENMTMKGRGVDKGRTKIALEEVLDGLSTMESRPYFVFRVHPIETAVDYAEYRDEIDRFSEDGSPLELVYAADLVIGMTSMLLLEAALMGKPCLAVLPDPSEKEWLPGADSGRIPCAVSSDEVRSMLARLLADDIGSQSPVIPETAAGAVERTVNFVAAKLQ